MKFLLRSDVKSKKLKSDEKDMIRFLSEVTIFQKLTKVERKNLQNYIHKRKYKENEYVFKKDYPNVVLYIVKEGKLNTYIDKSEKRNIKTIKPFEHFGEVGLFVEEKRTATIKAVPDSILLAISKRDLKNFMGEYPKAGNKILYQLAKVLSRHLIKANKKLLERIKKLNDLNKLTEEEKLKL